LNRLALQGTVTEQRQARYMLAADAIRAGDGAVALQLLEGLENRYTLLAPYILSLRAQAQMLLQQLKRSGNKSLSSIPKVVLRVMPIML
jgi:soluble lytic murein transglycosylase